MHLNLHINTLITLMIAIRSLSILTSYAIIGREEKNHINQPFTNSSLMRSKFPSIMS